MDMFLKSIPLAYSFHSYGRSWRVLRLLLTPNQSKSLR